MESTLNCPLLEHLLLQEILPRLPTKSVMRFKSVSKTWLSLISQHSSLIAAKHTAREKPGSIIRGLYKTDTYTINRLFFLGHNESNLVEIDTSYVYKKKPARVDLVGSCNGLVCLKLVYSDETHALVLWNPATKEVNYLPTREVYSDEKFSGYTLGFDAHSRVHKVVWLKQSFSKEANWFVKAQIFSQKSGRWRNLKSFTLMPATTVFLEEGYGLTVDGAIYWRDHPFNVLSFDLSKDEFREFDGPLSPLDLSIRDMRNFHFELINWKGSMGVVFVVRGAAEIQVWLKNKETNNTDSGWQKISTIQPSLGPISLGIVFSGQIVLIHYRDNSNAKKEIFYDLVTNEKREEQACLEKVWWFQACEHFYTLISPN